VTRLERVGLALALAAELVLLAGPEPPTSWAGRAAVVAFGVGLALVADPWRRHS
jgi:hypothetical protein